MDTPPKPRNVLEDFETNTSILLLVMFSISRTAQLYSRLHTGRLFFSWTLCGGLVLEGVYCVYKSGLFHADSTPLLLVVGLHLIALSLHGTHRAWRAAQGTYRHSYDPGRGLLEFLYPSLPEWASGLLSDLCAAICLGGLLHVLGSPVHRDWYLWVVSPSLVVSQAWVKGREHFLYQQHVDAEAQARYYASTIQRR